MSTPIWLAYLRTSSEAWEDYLSWLRQMRQNILERTARDFDAYKELIGEKKALDNIIHASTMDQKEDVAKQAYIEATNGR